MNGIIKSVILVALMLCSLLASVDYSEELDDSPVVEFIGGSQQQIGAFNQTIPFPINVVELQLDWKNNISIPSDTPFPTVQDFIQIDDGTYFVLLSAWRSGGGAGALSNGKQFRGGDAMLVHLDQDGRFIDGEVYSHDAWSSGSASTMVPPPYFHYYGATTLIILDDDTLVLAGTVGYETYNRASFAGIINNTGVGEHIFVAKVNITTWDIVDYIVFESQHNQAQYSCRVGVYEETFSNSTIFKLSIHLLDTNPAAGGHVCLNLNINGTYYTTSMGSSSSVNTNVLVTMGHDLSVINSIEIPSPNHDDSAPLLLAGGGALVQTNYRDIQYLNPGQNQWTTVNTGCYQEIEWILKIDSYSVVFPCIDANQNGTRDNLDIMTFNLSTGISSTTFIGSFEQYGSQLKCGGMVLSPSRMLITLKQSSGHFTSINGSNYYASMMAIDTNLISGNTTIVTSGALSSNQLIKSDVSNEPLRGTIPAYLRRTFIRGSSSLMFQSLDFSLQHLHIVEIDSDMDGHSDRIDAFPFDSSQQIDSDGDGFGDDQFGTTPDDCPYQSGNSTTDLLGCLDNDGDGQSNQGDAFPNDATQMFDSDSDGYGDNLSGIFGDTCPLTYGESTRDRYGCPDADFDGWSDDNDTFPNESSQWEDSDGDGYGDQLIGFQGDACPTTVGNSTEDRYGCPDADGDGWSDDGDDMPSNPTQWKDRDGDGYGDNTTGTMADAFPSDGTQWNDTDGDGHGDNPYGSEGDWFPEDPERWADADRDGVADEDDAFPNDATQWNDTDDDGYGDEETGNRGDAFPEDPEEWQDSDSDNVGNNADDFPFDPSQQSDSDGDGFGDNPLGSGADKFPDDPSQWSDIDGDGYGDNQTGTDADVFIADPTQHADRDGDGYGDSLSGRLADQFPDNPTQWIDQDGDGLGDNQSGTDADPYLFDFDNDGYNDSIDPLPMLASPGDIDNDGCLDEVDAFPLDYRECSDFDGDGDGDNADTDDDNDGWTDTDEMREDTDPFDASDYPIVAFQLMIPGTTIGLDGWDLIGIFGGVPLFAWILFGFVTRNKRCRKYEDMLNGASTKKELENIALKSEYSLMIRLLGPHQGIRLERLRAELDDALEGEGMPFDEDHTEVVENEMAEVNITEKNVEFDFDEAPNAPPAAIVAEGMSDGAAPDTTTPPHITTIGIVGQDGYEWLQQGGATWYRPANSGLDWAQWIQ
jgi:hypothetical protein